MLSKFLALGMPLPDVLRRASSAPARAIGLDVGTLAPGAAADVAVLERVQEAIDFGDGFGGTVAGSERRSMRSNGNRKNMIESPA